jgi:hypothetical protein
VRFPGAEHGPRGPAPHLGQHMAPRRSPPCAPPERSARLLPCPLGLGEGAQHFRRHHRVHRRTRSG